MKPTDFARTISDFLSKYLPGERGATLNTVRSYRDTFKLLIRFMNENKSIKVQKLKISHITKESVIEFLNYLETDRNCSAVTRNTRLAAIKCYFDYIIYKDIDNLHESQRILSIKKKNTISKSIKYLSLEAIKALLQQPDGTTRRGIRDLALLSLLYDTGARVQEIIDLQTNMVRLEGSFTVNLLGKRNKYRTIPVLDAQTKNLKRYMKVYNLDRPEAELAPLFFNSRNEKLSRQGITYILEKYVDLAKKNTTVKFPKKVSCHTLRHSKAMHLLGAGVDMIYIKDILGHSNLNTTEIYARADSKKKREAIEKAYTNLMDEESPKWDNNPSLISWLNSF